MYEYFNYYSMVDDAEVQREINRMLTTLYRGAVDWVVNLFKGKVT